MGLLKVTIVKANDLKNMELIGKSDPYVTVHIRPLFKVKTKVVNNNLNPTWNQTFDLIAEDKETQSLILEVFNLSTLYFPSFPPYHFMKRAYEFPITEHLSHPYDCFSFYLYLLNV